MASMTVEKPKTYFQSRYTESQTLQFIRQYQATKCKQSATALSEIFFKLMSKIAHGYCKSGILFEDAYAAAVVGLLTGIQSFEIEKYGIKSLSSYLTRSVNDHVSQELRGYTIKLGKNISVTMSAVKKHMADNNVDMVAACNALGLTRRRRFAVEQAMTAVGLSGITDELVKGLARDRKTILDKVVDEESEKAVYARLESLDDKFREVIKRRLDGQPVKQIAAELGVSLPTVSNRYKKGIELLSRDS